jgi:hypothetical protein
VAVVTKTWETHPALGHTGEETSRRPTRAKRTPELPNLTRLFTTRHGMSHLKGFRLLHGDPEVVNMTDPDKPVWERGEGWTPDLMLYLVVLAGSDAVADGAVADAAAKVLSKHKAGG